MLRAISLRLDRDAALLVLQVAASDPAGVHVRVLAGDRRHGFDHLPAELGVVHGLGDRDRVLVAREELLGLDVAADKVEHQVVVQVEPDHAQLAPVVLAGHGLHLDRPVLRPEDPSLLAAELVHLQVERELEVEAVRRERNGTLGAGLFHEGQAAAEKLRHQQAVVLVVVFVRDEVNVGAGVLINDAVTTVHRERLELGLVHDRIIEVEVVAPEELALGLLDRHDLTLDVFGHAGVALLAALQ
mmetsp:Transcript_2597/g.6679  ORF Transcript_2597/g.6679 Transcript_2597/m.6679 type:complete len:243 (-) Transcript_2597:1739-2467(-)